MVSVKKSKCVFCDLEVEHGKALCGRVKPLSKARRKKFFKLLDERGLARSANPPSPSTENGQ
jgi:hypothetical protein